MISKNNEFVQLGIIDNQSELLSRPQKYYCFVLAMYLLALSSFSFESNIEIPMLKVAYTSQKPIALFYSMIGLRLFRILKFVRVKKTIGLQSLAFIYKRPI